MYTINFPRSQWLFLDVGVWRTQNYLHVFKIRFLLWQVQATLKDAPRASVYCQTLLPPTLNASSKDLQFCSLVVQHRGFKRSFAAIHSDVFCPTPFHVQHLFPTVAFTIQERRNIKPNEITFFFLSQFRRLLVHCGGHLLITFHTSIDVSYFIRIYIVLTTQLQQIFESAFLKHLWLFTIHVTALLTTLSTIWFFFHVTLLQYTACARLRRLTIKAKRVL